VGNLLEIWHSIFTRNWTSDVSIRMVLDCVYGLMLNPEFDDPIDSNLASYFFSDRNTYNYLITEHTKKHAKDKTREAWNDELLKDEDKEEEERCKICQEMPCSICFIPCGHWCCCSNCSEKIDTCPLCRSKIEIRQRVIK